MSYCRAPRSRRARALLAGLLLVGCQDATAPTPERVGQVRIHAASTGAIVGQTLQLSATVHSPAGEVLADEPVRWYSDAPRVATVSHEGLITAVTPGTARITATAGTKTDRVEITIVPPPIGQVLLDVAGGDVRVGGTRGAEAIVYDYTGRRTIDQVVAWSLSDSTRARVESTGTVTAQVTGLAEGTTTLTARVGGKSASAVLQVRR